MCSAIALEASLPDCTMMPRRMSITVAWLLSGRYMHDSVLEPRHQAVWLTETRSSFLSLPERSACSTRKLVIILVSDAGGSGSSGLAEASTSPESKSISSQALAGIDGVPPATALFSATGAWAGVSALDFLGVACLTAWEAAKDSEWGTRTPAAMAMTTRKNGESVELHGLQGQNRHCRGSRADFERAWKIENRPASSILWVSLRIGPHNCV